MELAEYHEAHCLPSYEFTNVCDRKMAQVFEDYEKVYCENGRTEMKLRKFTNSDPSLSRNVLFQDKSFGPQTRLHAYDYPLHDSHKYVHETAYDPLQNYYTSWNYVNADEQSNFNVKRGHNRQTSKSTTSKSSDCKGRIEHLHNSNFSMGNISGRRSYYASKNGSIRIPEYNENIYSNMNPTMSYTAQPVPVMQKTPDLDEELWLNSQWSSRNSFRTPKTLSPSSPLDSGLSSQSIASSPSLEIETPSSRKPPHCRSPLSLPIVQKNQCSCYINLPVEPNLISPLLRSDSGRSSPWVQSTLTTPNEMAQTRPDFSHCVFTPTESIHEVDKRRYSMSGIYIHPSTKFHSHIITNKNVRNESRRISESNKLDPYVYEYEDKNIMHMFSPVNVDSPEKIIESRSSFMENDNPINKNNNGKYIDEFSERCDKSNKSSILVSTSNTSVGDLLTVDDKNGSGKCKKTSSSEKAISELEELYNKLNLQDYDLLDRAERRDLPTPHQVSIGKPRDLTRSKSDSFYEILSDNNRKIFRKSQRAPPTRRSGVPDLVADDMAMRKLQKSAYKSQVYDSTPTYMLYSSHFTPSIPMSGMAMITKTPDIDYDDFSFRRYFHLNSGKNNPQPPFGIPVYPNQPQSVFSDYMHVVPSCSLPPLCHSRRNPDLVRDDLAFRTLRKDNPERAIQDSYSLFYRKVR